MRTQSALIGHAWSVYSGLELLISVVLNRKARVIRGNSGVHWRLAAFEGEPSRAPEPRSVTKRGCGVRKLGTQDLVRV